MVQRYVLTERGKFLVAILVIVIFVIPGAILATWALTQEKKSNEAPPDLNGIHQNGTGSVSPAPSPENTPDPISDLQNDDNLGQTSLDPSITGPTTFDLDSGTMTFLFTPEQQDTLDDNTVSKIGELLASPKNTNDAKIVVEVPHLPYNETLIMTDAIINAFAANAVSQSNIGFTVYLPEVDTSTFEINISFK